MKFRYDNKEEERLFTAYYKAKEMLDDIGIEYGNIIGLSINTKATQRWGQCKLIDKHLHWLDRTYSINISSRLLKDGVNEDALMNTLIHEMLHTCEDCMNHGNEWKRLANKVNQAYGLNIKRCTSAEEKGVKEATPIKYSHKYIVHCPACGKNWMRYKKSYAVTHPENCGCGRCGHNGLVSWEIK